MKYYEMRPDITYAVTFSSNGRGEPETLTGVSDGRLHGDYIFLKDIRMGGMRVDKMIPVDRILDIRPVSG